MRRIAALLALLGSEIALALSLRQLGWFETGRALRWGASGLVLLLPLVIAAVIMLRNRLRYSLRTLLVAIALVAIFLFIGVLPLLEAFESRHGSQKLQAAGVEFRTTSSRMAFYRQIGLDPGALASHQPQSKRLPPWLQPLAGDTLKAPPDNAVREVWLESDAQVSLVCGMPERLPNLERIGIWGRVTPTGMEEIRRTVPKFRQVTALHVNNVAIPKAWLKSLPNVKTLFIWVEGSLEGQLLEPQHLQDVAKLPNLEVLMIAGYLVRSADMQALAGSESLRFILLRRTATAPWGKRELAEAMPNCVIRSE